MPGGRRDTLNKCAAPHPCGAGIRQASGLRGDIAPEDIGKSVTGLYAQHPCIEHCIRPLCDVFNGDWPSRDEDDCDRLARGEDGIGQGLLAGGQGKVRPAAGFTGKVIVLTDNKQDTVGGVGRFCRCGDGFRIIDLCS